MNKAKTLILILLLQASIAFGQRDPSKEILIFFKHGASREPIVLNGETVFQAAIKSSRLKSDLLKLGINEAGLEIANPRFNEADTMKIMQDGSIIKQLNMARLFRLKVPEGKSLKELLEAISKLPEVLYAEANGTVVPLAIPSDTRYNEQWGLHNNINVGADIHAEAAWDIYTGNQNNIIAIIDGGTDATHVDLNDKISGGDTGFGWAGHGIHVSGIAAAESNNAQGVSGVDWNARIHAQRIDNVTDDVDTYNAIVDAVNFSPNVLVLNNSWGMRNPDGTFGRNSITVRQAFAYAYKANRTSVVAMGNHQLTQPDVVAYPAGFENVIAVGATDNADVIAFFSAHGTHIDVSAPGVGILSTLDNGGYGNMDGTSMATPHVSGIASLLKGFSPNLTNNDIENIIRLSADDRGVVGFDNIYGAGRANAERALNFLRPPFSLNQWSASGGTDFSTTSNYNIQFFAVQGLASGNYSVKRHEVRKAVTFSKSFCQVTGVWGRGVSALGWNLANPNFGEGFCEVVPGTLTNTGATLRTFVYEVYTVLGQYVGYYPSTPANATFPYSVLGLDNPNTTVSGASPLCSTTQYSLQTIPAGSTISWLSSNPTGLQINPVSGSATRNNNFNGNVTVTATYNGGNCSGSIVSKNIYVGLPGATNTTLIFPSGKRGIDPVTLCAGCTYTFGSDFVSGATSFTWVLPSGFSFVSGSTTKSPGIKTSSTNGTYTLYCSADNSCGSSWTHNLTITIGGGGQQQIVVYPNPSSTDLTIEYLSSDSALAVESINGNDFTAKLIDESQNEVRIGSSLKGKIHFDTKDVREGYYYLHILIGKELITRHILIKK